MLRVAIVDSDDKKIDVSEIKSAIDLTSVAEQARTLIRDCEQLAYSKRTKSPVMASRVPYST